MRSAEDFVHSLLSRCALQLWFSPWSTRSRPPWSFYFAQCPMGPKFSIKAPLCGGEAPYAIRARKRCRHVARKWVRTPILGRYGPLLGLPNGAYVILRVSKAVFYDVAGRSTPYTRAEMSDDMTGKKTPSLAGWGAGHQS